MGSRLVTVPKGWALANNLSQEQFATLTHDIYFTYINNTPDSSIPKIQKLISVCKRYMKKDGDTWEINCHEYGKLGEVRTYYIDDKNHKGHFTSGCSMKGSKKTKALEDIDKAVEEFMNDNPDDVFRNYPIYDIIVNDKLKTVGCIQVVGKYDLGDIEFEADVVTDGDVFLSGPTDDGLMELGSKNYNYYLHRHLLEIKHTEQKIMTMSLYI